MQRKKESEKKEKKKEKQKERTKNSKHVSTYGHSRMLIFHTVKYPHYVEGGIHTVVHVTHDRSPNHGFIHNHNSISLSL